MHSSLRLAAVAAVAASSFFVPAAHGGVATVPGWKAQVTPVAPPTALIGGLDALHDGSIALFDGSSIVTIDPGTGAVTGTLYTPPPVFGSFVRATPDGAAVLFGESTTGSIVRVPLNGQPVTPVVNLPFNFSCAFDPSGRLFVTHAAPGFLSTSITLVDPATGATDLIATMSGPSGPIAFAADGALYYGTNTISFPAPIAQQALLRFEAAQIEGAIGPGALGDADAAFLTQMTAPAGLAIDAQGDVFVTDSQLGTLREYDAFGADKGDVAADLFGSVGPIALLQGTGGAQLGAFQPEAGGALVVASTDFFSFNDLNVVRPRRATVSTSPASPIPAGPFTLSVQDGPMLGDVILLVGAGPLVPEFATHVNGVAFLIGIAPGPIVVLPLLPLDVSGSIVLPAGGHSFGGITVTVQGALLNQALQPVGTTTAATFTLQ